MPVFNADPLSRFAALAQFAATNPGKAAELLAKAGFRPPQPTPDLGTLIQPSLAEALSAVKAPEQPILQPPVAPAVSPPTARQGPTSLPLIAGLLKPTVPRTRTLAELIGG